MHQTAYEEVCSYITENVIGKRNWFFLSFFTTIYKSNLERSLERLQNKDIYINLETHFHLEDKLLEKFRKKITIVTLRKKKVVKPYMGVFLKNNDMNDLEEEDILQRAALILRRDIREIEHRPLPDQLKTSDLINGECTLPTSLTRFSKLYSADPIIAEEVAPIIKESVNHSLLI